MQIQNFMKEINHNLYRVLEIIIFHHYPNKIFLRTTITPPRTLFKLG